VCMCVRVRACVRTFARVGEEAFLSVCLRVQYQIEQRLRLTRLMARELVLPVLMESKMPCRQVVRVCTGEGED